MKIERNHVMFLNIGKNNKVVQKKLMWDQMNFIY